MDIAAAITICKIMVMMMMDIAAAISMGIIMVMLVQMARMVPTRMVAITISMMRMVTMDSMTISMAKTAATAETRMNNNNSIISIPTMAKEAIMEDHMTDNINITKATASSPSWWIAERRKRFASKLSDW
jgi:hypothetical protein